MNFLINELSSASNGVVVISAATSSELAYETDDWNNGAFTKAVVEGVNGAADFRNNGQITYPFLFDYVTNRVRELTRDRQHPALGAQAVQNLLIARTR